MTFAAGLAVPLAFGKDSPSWADASVVAVGAGGFFIADRAM